MSKALEVKYFVLKPKAKGRNDRFARASQEAMLKYAEIIKPGEPSFARELTDWVKHEQRLMKALPVEDDDNG